MKLKTTYFSSGASGIPANNGSQFLPSSTGQTGSVCFRNVNNISDLSGGHLVESEKRSKLLDSQKDLHAYLKPEISKLCEVLHFPVGIP